MIKNKNKYDHLFKNVSPASMSGIHIFGADDDYFKPQKYNDVTNLENRIWEDLFINSCSVDKVIYSLNWLQNNSKNTISIIPENDFIY